MERKHLILWKGTFSLYQKEPGRQGHEVVTSEFRKVIRKKQGTRNRTAGQ